MRLEGEARFHNKMCLFSSQKYDSMLWRIATQPLSDDPKMFLSQMSQLFVEFQFDKEFTIFTSRLTFGRFIN